MRAELVHLAAALTGPSGRAAAADDLARALHAEALIVFVRDQEVGALLSAPGFPRTIPGGRAWRAFLDQCVLDGRHSGVVPLASMEDRRPAIGVAVGDGAVGVLIGGDPTAEDVDSLALLLPLVVSGFRGEQLAETAEAKARLARGSAAQERALAAALEAVRTQLQLALTDARRARRDLEQQAAELETQTEDLRAANIELVKARLTADEANRAKSEFLATMSHELRTPLNAIGGYVQLLEMGVYGPIVDAQREACQRVTRSQRHLLGIINDILNFARIEAGRVEYDIRRTPLVDVFVAIRELIEPLAAERRQVLDVRNPEPDVAVLADADKLEQILVNLASNAVKFTPPGGRIALEARASEGSTTMREIRVTDTGRGISADKLDAIFDPFVQVNGLRSRDREGTGLGLAISRDLAKGMKGQLTVQSEIGIGSTFTLALPSA